MKLLFLTQVIDSSDAVLGFVSRWVAGLAGACERVRVVALEAGVTDDLPANVDVCVVGRKGVVGRYLRYRAILREALVRDGFDAVLAHMVPRYALVAAGPARRAGAKLFLWYTHKAVDARLRRAVARVDKAFTASAESLRIDAPNKVVTGHGIDLAHFDARSVEPERPARLLTVGRLTPAKDPLTAIAALAILVARGHDLFLDVVGGELAAGDDAYARTVRDAIESGGVAGRIALHGAVPYRDVPPFFRRASILVHTSRTGSVDKVVLEALACGRPVVTSNESFGPILEPLGERAQMLRFPPGDATLLAARVEALLALSPGDLASLRRDLRALAREHEVDALMRRLVAHMEATR